VVAAPSTEVIGAAATITANACGTVKRLSATANRTTDTTDTFTAPTASYAGCCMDVVNVDTVDTITLDNNAKFITGPGADLAVGPGKAVRVCSDGTSWYQASTVTSAAATILAIDDLSDAFTDYAVENNLIMGRAGAAALAAGAQRNVFIGQNAGATTANSTATTDSNTAVGYTSLASLTSGDQNTAIGRNSLQLAADASWNTAVGNQALQQTTSGDGNTAIGSVALLSNVAKQESTAACSGDNHEVVAAAAVITANACGTVKQISATANRTTEHNRHLHHADRSYAGCCMDVVNVDTVDTITLDQNANFFTGPGTDLALGPARRPRLLRRHKLVPGRRRHQRKRQATSRSPASPPQSPRTRSTTPTMRKPGTGSSRQQTKTPSPSRKTLLQQRPATLRS
jgi:hypothetical protein